MRPEVSPTGRPLPKEAIIPSSQESLASQMLRALEGETYNLREAAKLLNRLAEQRGIETRISHETLRTWGVITLAEIVKPIAFLPQEELTPEVFREKFPDEEGLPLSAGALLFRGESGRCKYTLSIKDLDFIISRAQGAYKEGLRSSFGRAKKIIVSFQERCLRLNEIAGRLERKASRKNFLKKNLRGSGRKLFYEKEKKSFTLLNCSETIQKNLRL